jgi:transcriptional regulator with XRE-family HTH domain
MSKRQTIGSRALAAREAKGWSLWQAARRLKVGPMELRRWESGREDIPLSIRQAMAAAYGTAPQYLVPDRPAAAEHDAERAVIRIGSVAFTLDRSDDDTLRRFLAAVREERGIVPGAPVAVRESDAAFLADLLGGTREDISRSLRRLLGLSETEADDFSQWVFGRTAVAAVLAGDLSAAVMGTTTSETGAAESEPAHPAPEPAGQ